jgi:hypothetical protein
VKAALFCEGGAVLLARVAASDDVHQAAKRSSVKRANIVFDREHGEHTVELPLKQGFTTPLAEFNRCDGFPSAEVTAVEPSSTAGEQGEFSKRLSM